jgi:hypothetical protein
VVKVVINDKINITVVFENLKVISLFEVFFVSCFITDILVSSYHYFRIAEIGEVPSANFTEYVRNIEKYDRITEQHESVIEQHESVI